MTIALEFDGVIVEDNYPEIGEEIPFAFDTLKKIQNKRHQIILWTRRSGKELQAALDYCAEHDFSFYAINKSYPEEQIDKDAPRKILADLYLENRMVETLPDWGFIYQLIMHRRHLKEIDSNHDFEYKQKRSFLSRLFSSY